MRKRRILVPVLALAVLACAGAAGAWALRDGGEASTEERGDAQTALRGRDPASFSTALIARDARDADLVINGEVVSFGDAVMLTGGPAPSIYTPTTIRIEERIAGDVPGNEVVVSVAGGCVLTMCQFAGYGQEELIPGDEVVVFLLKASAPHGGALEWSSLRAYHIDQEADFVAHMFSFEGAPLDEFVALVKRTFDG
jgi:hypothetical protein